MSKPLDGRVCVVAGATRGAGRGIACCLGEAGAIVYCTGRSTRGHAATPGRPETIDETAELVTARGGRGVAVQVDHSDPEQVEALFQRVRRDHDRLDVLVNDIWGGDALTEFGTPFWELSLEKGLELLPRALFTHIITARHGTPLMLERDRGLIVEVTDGDLPGYRGHLFYDLAKSSVVRLAYGMSMELRERGVTALAVTPGFLRSEAMLDHFGVTEANWRDAGSSDPHFLQSETPYYVGRAVAALAADPQVGAKAGGVYGSWTLAREYGFCDVDGRQPDFASYIDGITDEIAARGPANADERMLVEFRWMQVHNDAGRAEQAARLAAVLRPI